MAASPRLPHATAELAGGAVAGSQGFFALAGLDQAAMDALPEAVYLCADDGRVIRFNQKAADLWGRTPRAGDPGLLFCGSLRLYRTDGTLLPHDQCPMAVALQTGESFYKEEVMVERPNGERLTVLVNVAALKAEDGRVTGAVNCFQDITDRKQAEHRQSRLFDELNHRIKNTLATVHSIATLTARDAKSTEEFTARFEARLLALSQAHTLLSQGRWSGVKLRDLLALQLEPFGLGENPGIQIDGPEVDVEPRSALSLGMAFHELAANAAKYGPLSVACGRISVRWELAGSEGGVLNLQWLEAGGPPVEAPQQSGFGTRLIKQIIAGELSGHADLRFEPSGFQFHMSMPLRT
jgi:two-component sensor histidine kinase